MSDIEYKTGDADLIGAVLRQNGVPINLTGCTVTFTIKSSDGATRLSLPCTLGGTYNGTNVPASEGGVTIIFGTTATATAGQYRCEFVVTNSDNIAHIPSGNNFLTLTIWEAL